MSCSNSLFYIDAQVISGGWRLSTFSAHQSTFTQSSLQKFLDSIHTTITSKILLPFLVAVYGTSARISSKHEQSVRSIISKAYNWNQMVKSEVILLDFHPVMCSTGTRFDPVAMDGPPDQTFLPTQAEPIISTVSLGLQSSEAEGGGRSPMYIWQDKVTVLTDVYFE